MPEGPAVLDASTRTADERLSDWLRSAEERFAWFKHAAHSREVAKATRLFGTRSGRAHGRIALQRAFDPVATLQAIGDGPLPYLCWALFRPQPNTVAVNFGMVLRFPDGRISIVSMTWTADVAHDALSDALRGGQDLDAVLMELHAALLDAPAGAVDVDAELAVPAGGGHFVGRFVRATAGSEPCVIFHAARWVPGQPDEAEPIGVAAEGEPSMASGAMDPLRLASAQWPTPETRAGEVAQSDPH